MNLFTTFHKIRPMWVCWICRKQSMGQVEQESPEHPEISILEPDGWTKVWKGYAGWVWTCGCTQKGGSSAEPQRL
jgi:hypothetical protein